MPEKVEKVIILKISKKSPADVKVKGTTKVMVVRVGREEK